MIKLGILGSTKGTDLQAILDGIDSGELNAQVSIVVSNRENAFILKRAKANNIPFSFISHKGKSRTEFDSQMTEVFKMIDNFWNSFFQIIHINHRLIYRIK